MERLFKFILATAMLVTVFVFATSCGLDRKIHSWLYPKYKTTEIKYIMRNGDTVWDVAENYFLEQDKIKTLNEFIYSVRYRNGLTQSKHIVKMGDVIYIPLSKKIAQ